MELLDGPLGRDAEGVFGDAAKAAREVLEQTSIADVIEREAREAGREHVPHLNSAGRVPLASALARAAQKEAVLAVVSLSDSLSCSESHE